MLTSFYGVFKEKYERLKKDLEKELKRAKSDRRRDWMKAHIKEIKDLKQTLKEMDESMGLHSCPNCGYKLK